MCAPLNAQPATSAIRKPAGVGGRPTYGRRANCTGGGRGHHFRHAGPEWCSRMHIPLGARVSVPRTGLPRRCPYTVFRHVTARSPGIIVGKHAFRDFARLLLAYAGIKRLPPRLLKAGLRGPPGTPHPPDNGRCLRSAGYPSLVGGRGTGG